jgi:hypothetical protein
MRVVPCGLKTQIVLQVIGLLVLRLNLDGKPCEILGVPFVRQIEMPEASWHSLDALSMKMRRPFS